MSDSTPRGPAIAEFYSQYLENQDSTVFVDQVSKFYSVGTLERLSEHPLREVRRAAVLALGFVGDYNANQALGRALIDDDRCVRILADTGIRTVWTRDGEPPHRQQLALIIRLIAAGQYGEAIHRAGRLVDAAPWFAEAWNQRAVAHFNREHYAESIRDGHQALEINPYHFQAAASMGQAYLRIGNHVAALECFRRALRLNPDLEGVRVQVVRLVRLVEGK